MSTILPNIAFIGRAGSGKTTCREYLEEAFGYERISFAAPLKIACGTTDDRSLLQRVGHGVRELHEDFWVNLLLAQLDGSDEAHAKDWSWSKYYANDDTRYPNEAQALRGRGFVIVRVVAPASLRRMRLHDNGRLQNEDQLTHISETALDDFEADYKIVNDGWTTDLHGDLDHIVNQNRS